MSILLHFQLRIARTGGSTCFCLPSSAHRTSSMLSALFVAQQTLRQLPPDRRAMLLFSKCTCAEQLDPACALLAAAREQLQRMPDQYLAVADSGLPSHAHLAAEDRDTLRKEATAALDWLDGKVALQAQVRARLAVALQSSPLCSMGLFPAGLERSQVFQAKHGSWLSYRAGCSPADIHCVILVLLRLWAAAEAVRPSCTSALEALHMWLR